ncbi:MAG: PIN domain-containing protein [Bifidobacteriaceae bacterium]|jgi:predicted nucleic acid-binding protein|nr:PIN domain-containing protein [Bifidobacteriaceae bacterium]
MAGLSAVETLYLSSITLAELLFGVGALPSGRRKDRLERTLDGLFALFAGRVLPFDQDAARRYATLAVTGRAAGGPLPAADGYVVATALARGFAVATRNVWLFMETEAKVIDPWSGR